MTSFLFAKARSIVYSVLRSQLVSCASCSAKILGMVVELSTERITPKNASRRMVIAFTQVARTAKSLYVYASSTCQVAKPPASTLEGPLQKHGHVKVLANGYLAPDSSSPRL
jgi:hypothetical protein